MLEDYYGVCRLGVTGDAENMMARSGGYDAFVSYCHADDDVFAATLQTGLERFARPWYRPRVLRVFRDTTNLSAAPGLWSSIVEAMRASDWFILVASKKAADSSWVGQEAAWWLANKNPASLLIALADGTIEWSGTDFDWHRTDCLPPQLSGAFPEEPHWVNLRNVRAALFAASQSAERSGLRRRQVRDQVGNWVADLAAPIRGINKDDLVGEHIRQRRRTRRTVQTVVSVLVILAVTASAAAAIAVGQRDVAVAQTRIATAREAAAVAVANLQTHLNIAELLAVAAYKMDSTPETEAALFQAADASPQLERYLQVGAPVSALGTSADGNVVVAGTANGDLSWFNLATGKRLEARALSGTINQVSVSADGTTVVAGDGREAVAWRAVPGRVPQLMGKASSVAVSASGQLAAMLNTAPGDTAGSRIPLTVRDIGSGHQIRARVSGAFSQVIFSGLSMVTVLNGGGPWEKLALPDLRRVAGSTAFLAPAGGYITAVAANGEFSGYDKYGSVNAWPTDSPGTVFLSGLGGVAPDAPASALAISSDGTSVAAVESGIIYVGPLQRSVARGPGAVLEASADTSDVAFLGSDKRLVSAAGDTLALWNLAQTSRLSHSTGIPIADSGTIGYPPALQFSPNGRLLAIASSSAGGNVYGRLRLPPVAAFSAEGLPLWNGSQLWLVGQGSGYQGLSISNDHGQVIRQWDNGQEAGYVESVHLLPGGIRLAALDDVGGITVYNVLTGKVQKIRPDGGPSTSYVFPQQGDMNANGTAAAFANNGSGHVLYVDLLTGASHVVGNGAADGILFTRNYLFIQRSSGVLQVWDANARNLLRQVPGSGGYANAIAVSPNGLLVARLSDEGTVTIASLATGDTLATFELPFPGNTTAVDPWNATSLAFTPDGHSLLTASSGGELVRWDIYPPDLARIACTIAGQRLTAAEWQFYVHASPPNPLSCQRA